MNAKYRGKSIETNKGVYGYLREIMTTRIICHVESCRYRIFKGPDKGVCSHGSIHLQPCSCDAPNIVGCSEFLEEELEGK